MNSALIAHLEAQAASATTEVARLSYRAQWACAAARLGQIPRARSEIEALRSKNTAYVPEVTAWILLAEGMADHFESLSATALDRFKRAYGLAIALGNSDIRSTAAAWMGASEFLQAKYETAAEHALEAIEHAPADNPLAKARAHLVLANCLNGAAGAPDLARLHYAKARQFSVEARDISMQSVVLYNVATFHVSRISIDDAFGDPVEDECSVAELEVNSIDNLDSGLGLESLQAMVPLLRAELHLIRKQWLDADALYAKFTLEATTHGQTHQGPRFLAERAQCQAMLGQRESAARIAAEAIERLVGRIDADDNAACHARLSLCFAYLGDGAASRNHRDVALRSRAEFAEFQRELRPKIVSIAGGVLDE